MKTFNEILANNGLLPKQRIMKPNKMALKMYPEITRRLSQGETVDNIFLGMDWQNYGVKTLQGQGNIDIDLIKDKTLNKKAFAALKKGQKIFFSKSDNELATWAKLKGDVDSINDLYKYTDYQQVIAPGKQTLSV